MIELTMVFVHKTDYPVVSVDSCQGKLKWGEIEGKLL